MPGSAHSTAELPPSTPAGFFMESCPISQADCPVSFDKGKIKRSNWGTWLRWTQLGLRSPRMTPIHRKQVGRYHGDATIRKSFKAKKKKSYSGKPLKASKHMRTPKQLSGHNPEMKGLLVFKIWCFLRTSAPRTSSEPAGAHISGGSADLRASMMSFISHCVPSACSQTSYTSFSP